MNYTFIHVANWYNVEKIGILYCFFGEKRIHLFYSLPYSKINFEGGHLCLKLNSTDSFLLP